MQYLFDKPFTWLLQRDENRVADGLNLRYRFGYECGMDYDMVTAGLGNRPCSVLEVMAALSLRCEETIMSDPMKGNRTKQWFWGMLKSLGLTHMRNDDFDIQEADDIIERFLNRRYSPNGNGGLFTLSNCKTDLRTVEIWCQANWYFNEVIEYDRHASQNI